MTAAIGHFIFQEPFNLKTLIGLTLIIGGVFLLNSKRTEAADQKAQLTIEI
ncbi:hypothetical protein CHCC20441_3734 [Bacillus licheniformis]|nr:hypothetical protein CHCC5026_0347 [Bacillus licheniformis]TWJ98941.1 hypothetical protein CHCC20493_1481 [Bacillus licheniformis]TWK06161.1 hypothetical protein CHCC20441_3734 [Bacillus licheniformis]TWK18034.1 hypothetical protein CHCC20440_3214 [Bacillus licheniformis]TWK93431.1 hypothetical protein CHCC20325_1955 [Bacillus licheniformis]